MTATQALYTTAIPAHIVARYQGYRSEYAQADAAFRTLLRLDRTRGLHGHETARLNRLEEECCFYRDRMRWLEGRYPGIEWEAR